MPIYPTFENEYEYWSKDERIIVGIDEVGRGALAGPVVVGAVAFTPQFDLHPNATSLMKVRDSKTLTRLSREKLAINIQSYALSYGIGLSEAHEVDSQGIRHATHNAALRALASIALQLTIETVFSDASLLCKNHTFPYKYLEITKGDQVCFSISSASILAKVWRDEYMTKLALLPEYSMYGWDHNAGYGTKQHREAIQIFGSSDQHRVTFLTHLK